MHTRSVGTAVQQQQNRHVCSWKGPVERIRNSKRIGLSNILYKTINRSLVVDAILDARYKPFLDAWDTSFIDTPEDRDGYYVDRIIGKIPEELEGTFFRNGPNKFLRVTAKGEERYAIQHPYDGDGFVCSLSIKEGKAFFRSRFVETFEFQAEEKEGRLLFRGTFATQRNGGASKNAGDVYVKNTSNTNICYFKGNLWALFEAG